MIFAALAAAVLSTYYLCLWWGKRCYERGRRDGERGFVDVTITDAQGHSEVQRWRVHEYHHFDGRPHV